MKSFRKRKVTQNHSKLYKNDNDAKNNIYKNTRTIYPTKGYKKKTLRFRERAKNCELPHFHFERAKPWLQNLQFLIASIFLDRVHLLDMICRVNG